MNEIRLVVLGALGRLGSAIVQEAQETEGFSVVAGVDLQKSNQKGGIPRVDSLNEVSSSFDVLVDATWAKCVGENVIWAVEKRVPYLLPVTGIDEKTNATVDKAAGTIPIVAAPNLSLGVAVLNELVTLTSGVLKDAEVEIVETHHRYKKDAPSGTALALARLASNAKGRGSEIVVNAAPGKERNASDVIVHALRGGDVVGEHHVSYFLEGERIELSHIATTRRIFAKGALAAARFLVGRSPGRYTMRDVLGLAKQ